MCYVGLSGNCYLRQAELKIAEKRIGSAALT
jgi:hypothetical protein